MLSGIVGAKQSVRGQAHQQCADGLLLHSKTKVRRSIRNVLNEVHEEYSVSHFLLHLAGSEYNWVFFNARDTSRYLALGKFLKNY
jgi:hypothetical protein